MNNRYAPSPPLRIHRGRAAFFLVLPALSFAVLVAMASWRLHHFMPKLRESVNDAYYFERTLFGHRGDMVDVNDWPLAANSDTYHAVADPQILRQTHGKGEKLRRLAARVAAILNRWEEDDNLKMSAEKVMEKLSSPGVHVSLKKKIPPFVAEELDALQVRGIETRYQSKRFYPQGEMGLPVVGYINHEGRGKVGMERMRHDKLSPEHGRARGMRTSGGAKLREIDFQPAKNGDRLRLAIDSRLQFLAYESLQRARRRHRAAAAAAVVMDVRNGGIVALVNAPSFNPNNIRRGDVGLTGKRNYAIADVVEPGSIVKPFVVALAMEQGKTRPGEIFPTAKPHRIDKHLTVRDEHIRENLPLEGIIQKSSNIGAVLLAHRVGKESLWKFYQQLGFGGEEVLHLPGENTGVLRPHEQWRRTDFATHAYGYGFNATLLQLLRAYSVFAADGYLLQPSLVYRGEARADHKGPRVLSAQTAVRVRKMMEGVVQIDGTAPAAAIAGFRVAGKTGTAKKVGGNHYEEKKYRAFFVGMAPAGNPRYIVAVMVDEPRQNGVGGGVVAAPVFREIMRRTLLLNGVAPDAASNDV